MNKKNPHIVRSSSNQSRFHTQIAPLDIVLKKSLSRQGQNGPTKQISSNPSRQAANSLGVNRTKRKKSSHNQNQLIVPAQYRREPNTNLQGKPSQNYLLNQY